MKVILYMATTVNGFIAKENDDTSFVSATEWKNFRAMIKRVGNMVIGRRTYEIMQKDGGFRGLTNIKVVVVTSSSSFKTNSPKHFVAKSTKAALRILRKQRFLKALVAGGGILNASFMKENLIDEIYLDIEPIVFGKGIRLFTEKDFEAKLKFMGIKKFSPNELQLHYKVKK